MVLSDSQGRLTRIVLAWSKSNYQIIHEEVFSHSSQERFMNTHIRITIDHLSMVSLVY